MAYTPLLTYVPAVGLKAGGTYAMPPLKDDFNIQPYHNRLANIHQESEESFGVYLSSGAGPMLPSYGELQATFIISQAYLIAQYGNGSANYAGMYTAKHDFDQYVVDGGLGTLTETLPSGVLQGLAGATVTQRSCTCVVSGTPKFDYKPGAPILEITIILLVPSARWTLTLSGGSTITFPIT